MDLIQHPDNKRNRFPLTLVGNSRSDTSYRWVWVFFQLLLDRLEDKREIETIVQTCAYGK